MTRKFALISLTCLWMYSTNGQSFSNGTLNGEIGLNAYTISLSTELKEKWLINAGYQTNDFHFLNIEDATNNADAFKDRLYGALLFPLFSTEKIKHYFGVGAALFGTTNSAGSATVGLSGTLNYKLTYPLSDKLAASGNVYILNGQPNELSLGINYRIF